MIQEKVTKVTSIFRQTYQLKEKTDTGDIWCTQAMDRIRNLGPLPSGTDVFMWFEQFVWRLSPAALALILVTVFCLTQLDVLGDHAVYSLFEDADKITLAQVFVP